MTSRSIVRCTEGHPYDRNAHEVCPVCGAAPIQSPVAPLPPSPTPQPTPAPRRVGLIGGIVAVAIGLGGLGLYFHRPAKEAPAGADMTGAPAPKVEPKTNEQAEAPKSEAPRSEVPKSEARSEAPPLLTQAPPLSTRSPSPADAGPLAQNLKRPPETDAEAEARVAKFMSVDPAVLEPLKRALSPIDPKDVDPLLASLSPAGADALHLSVLLREMLVNQSADVAFKAHDIAKAKLLLSALVSEPPLAPGVIPFVAHTNLAFLLSGTGAPQDDLETAGRLVVVAAKQGFPAAVSLLHDRPNLLAAAAVDPATMGALLKLAALQNPQLSPAAAQHGVDTNVLDAVRNAFYTGLQHRDWPAAIAARQSIGEPQIPLLDSRFARTLLFDRDHARFLDRALVGGVAGTMAFSYGAYDTLSYFPEYGLDGVVKDAPNAAAWMMMILKGVPPNDTSWNHTRDRYAKIKQTLSPDQSQALAQMAQQLGAP